MARKFTQDGARLKRQENDIKAWKRKLLNDRDGARKIVDHVITRLHAQNTYHYTELAQFQSRMLNGCAHPGDFGLNDENGMMKVA